MELTRESYVEVHVYRDTTKATYDDIYRFETLEEARDWINETMARQEAG